MQPAIRVENLGKRYRISHEGTRHERYKTLRDQLSDLATAPLRRLRNGGHETSQEDFWALKDVSFEVQPGEVVGIIGRNGAGKSTLLKILSRITKPTSGRVELRGRVGSLLEVGTGFHPELTGRENIYLNGSILGMARGEIDDKFDEIVDFAGIDRFLDTPVKRYSSGMYVRLAFSVAAHLQCEILIVDEVLAVGDQMFQEKCAGKMSDITKSGRTILFVSHNLQMLARLCDRAVWLDRGMVKRSGETEPLIAAFCHQSSATTHIASVDFRDRSATGLSGSQIIERVTLRDKHGRPTTGINLGDPLSIEMDVAPFSRRFGTNIVVELNDSLGTRIGTCSSSLHSRLALDGKGQVRVHCDLPALDLVPGEYSLSFKVGDTEDYFERHENAMTFAIMPFDVFGTGFVPTTRTGTVVLRQAWSMVR